MILTQRPVADGVQVDPGQPGELAADLVRVGGAGATAAVGGVYFPAYETAAHTTAGLYYSDGTAAGTTLVGIGFRVRTDPVTRAVTGDTRPG